MNYRTLVSGLIAALTLALIATSAHAVQYISLGTAEVSPSSASFLIHGETADLTLLTASFTDTIYGDTSFDDVFIFTSTLFGVASASVTVSPAGPLSQITIDNLIFNGHLVSPTDAALGLDLFQVTPGIRNTIEITGRTSSQTIFGSFTGVANFEASAVPEPTSWAGFIFGFGLIGRALRRKVQAQIAA